MATTHDDHQIFGGPATFQGPAIFNGALTLPALAVNNAAVAVSAEIAASKLVHRHSKTFQQATGTDVVTATYLLHLARAAGTVKGLKVRPITAPTGGDKQFTVDIKKVPSGTAIAAGTTLLTTPLVISSADANNTNDDASLIATPTYATGDMIIAIVTASGTTGSQGQGFLADVKLDESGV